MSTRQAGRAPSAGISCRLEYQPPPPAPVPERICKWAARVSRLPRLALCLGWPTGPVCHVSLSRPTVRRISASAILCVCRPSRLHASMPMLLCAGPGARGSRPAANSPTPRASRAQDAHTHTHTQDGAYYSPAPPTHDRSGAQIPPHTCEDATTRHTNRAEAPKPGRHA
eukprot:scaffold24008_cov124-Isochrysis_galbana.AAC.1